MKIRVLTFSTLVALVMITTAFAQNTDMKQGKTDVPTMSAAKTSSTQTITMAAQNAGSFNTFLAALKAADLTKWLDGKGPYTVFAPTDDAFAKIPKDQLDALMKDKDRLTQVLKYHVVAGNMTDAQVAALNGKTMKTESGKSISVATMQGKVMVDSGITTGTELKCKNGIIHPIDTVLMVASAPAPQATPQQPKY